MTLAVSAFAHAVDVVGWSEKARGERGKSVTTEINEDWSLKD